MRFEYTNGVYEGDVDYDDKPNGYGTFRWDDGDVYEGYWSHDQRHGRGTFRSYEGWSYTGDYYNDEMHGHGRYTFDDGGYYEGEFRNGDFNGKGKRVYADGTYYDGEWKDDEKNGYGIGTYADGSYYKGHWINGDFNGHGRYTFDDGGYYEGEFRNGDFNGRGYCKYANGNSYEGYWKDDEWHGSGKLIQNDGIEVEGKWEGPNNATDVILWHNGKTHKGKCVNGKFVESNESIDARQANLGSTAKILPQNLIEDLALQEVKLAPFASDAKVLDLTMKDSRWSSSDGWVKMERIVHIRKFVPSEGGSGEIDVKIVVHYVANRTKNLVDDFKIKSIVY